MEKINAKKNVFQRLARQVWDKSGFDLRRKLITLFAVLNVIPLIFLTIIAWRQFELLGDDLKTIAVEDSAVALNDSAIENIERMSTDAANRVAEFLYGRDDDIRYLSRIRPSEESYLQFINARTGRMMVRGTWALDQDKQSWVRVSPAGPVSPGGVSTNEENNDMNGFRYRMPDNFRYENVPLYDEITFIDLDGNELVKVVSSGSTKKNYPVNPQKGNVSKRENTYVRAETYFEKLKTLAPGDIFVSDVIGAYVGSNYIGMYVPGVVEEAAKTRGYDIPFAPQAQAYAGKENPNGQRFEGIVRWAAPVTGDDGAVVGYVSFALNHDHIMEFMDHLTPMYERYTELPSAFEGNYAFIWDYKCRSIVHPRHHSIAGFNPETGDPEVPWLESTIYDAWQASGVEKWTDFVADWPVFDAQSRNKKPAPALTAQGLVGLDGRYLNNAPQCTGWMDLTRDGGSGSFYILWSGLYKLTTAAAIPYYTGQYAPSAANDYSRRGFGFVAIGAGLEDFTRPAAETEVKLTAAVRGYLTNTSVTLVTISAGIIVLVVLLAIWIASFLNSNIASLIKGVSRFRAGERQFRFNAPVKDEFGTLADAFDDMADSIDASVKNPLSIIGMDHRIIYMNDYGLSICGMTIDEAVGTFYSESSVYPVDTKYDPVKALEEQTEAEIYYLESAKRYVKGTANYFFSKEGEKIGYIISSSDLTELVLAQLKLEKAVEDANRANQHKGEFLARMSHEIRTPMNAIIGITNIVQRKLENPGFEIKEIKGHVNQIEASSQHLLGLLNDVLDLSKIEAGKIELSDETMELKKLIETVSNIIRPRCNEKNITFKVSCDVFGHTAFKSDPLRLRQVLINLLGNSVKFTPELGSIEFRIENLDRADGKTLVRFSVIDTGIGIAEDALPNIFQSFEQGGSKVSVQYGGTGLGLAISSLIVQLFGGDISVKSKLGEGSAFSFGIWLTETEPDMTAAAVVSDITGKFIGKRALIVDDVEINRMIVNAMLEESGMELLEAADGLEAVNMFAESEENGIDIIFMDIQMPNMDGYAASDAIRSMDRADAHKVPIIALTANAFREDISKALSHGMNSHIAKPVEMDSMIETLFRFLPVDTE